VAEHDDLEVLGTLRADSETGEHGDEAVENAGHSWSASAAFPLISAKDRIFDASLLSRGDFWRVEARLNEPAGVEGPSGLALVVGSGK